MNYIAILVAGGDGFAIGALWFSPLLFGNIWMRLMKMDAKAPQPSHMPLRYGLSLFSTLVMAAAIGELWLGVAPKSIGMSIMGALCIWLGFIVVTQSEAVIWGQKPIPLFLLEIGHHLTSLVVMSTIIFYL